MTVAPKRLAELQAREDERFAREHPRSRELAEAARAHLLAGVPMHWMAKWPGGFPVVVDRAKGSRFVDVDGNEYVDFCLGDTGAMSGHSPAPTLRRQAHGGVPRGGGRARRLTSVAGKFANCGKRSVGALAPREPCP